MIYYMYLPEVKSKSSITGEEGSPRLDKNSFRWSSLCCKEIKQREHVALKLQEKSHTFKNDTGREILTRFRTWKLIAQHLSP